MLQTLGGDRLGMQVAGGAEHGHEQLGLQRDVAAAPVIDRQQLPGEVHEQPLTGPMFLAHRQVQVALKAPIVQTELGVRVAVGVVLPILMPQQHQRQPRPAQLAVNPPPVRQRPVGLGGRSLREQQRLQGDVIELVGQRPPQPGPLGPAHMVAGGRERHTKGRADLAKRHALMGQSKDLTDSAHGETGVSASATSSEQTPSEDGWRTQLTRGPSPTPRGVYENRRNRCTESSGIAVRNLRNPQNFGEHRPRVPQSAQRVPLSAHNRSADVCGQHVRVLARSPDRISAALEPLGVDGVESARRDLTESAAVERVLEGFDAVLSPPRASRWKFVRDVPVPVGVDVARPSSPRSCRVWTEYVCARAGSSSGPLPGGDRQSVEWEHEPGCDVLREARRLDGLRCSRQA
jgi:hypothetical protein